MSTSPSALFDWSSIRTAIESMEGYEGYEEAGELGKKSTTEWVFGRDKQVVLNDATFNIYQLGSSGNGHGAVNFMEQMSSSGNAPKLLGSEQSDSREQLAGAGDTTLPPSKSQALTVFHETELESLRRRMRVVEAEVRDQRDNVRRERREKERLQRRHEQLKVTMEGIKEEADELRREREDLEARIGDLEEENRELREGHEEVKQGFNRDRQLYERRMERLHDVVSRLRAERKESQQQSRDTEGRLREQVEKTEQANADLQSKVDAFEKKVLAQQQSRVTEGRLREQVEKTEQANAGLQRKLDAVERELQAQKEQNIRDARKYTRVQTQSFLPFINQDVVDALPDWQKRNLGMQLYDTLQWTAESMADHSYNPGQCSKKLWTVLEGYENVVTRTVWRYCSSLYTDMRTRDFEAMDGEAMVSICQRAFLSGDEKYGMSSATFLVAAVHLIYYLGYDSCGYWDDSDRIVSYQTPRALCGTTSGW
ncbi:hypothetical protein BDZ91DRAFT_717069 [Kalaharituber pfeilii]|nr:hypothetical protein BDZ91DRAFT_717069 [Kalaharituber pfeilii]